jgi:hypothetical protein
MSTIAQQFGIAEALQQLGVKDINPGSSTGSNWFANGEIIESYSPVDGQLIGKVQATTKEDYEKVMAAATEAFKEFRTMPAPKRGEIVRQFGNKLRELKEPLGKLVSYEMGKSLQEGYGEVQEMIDICDFAVGLSRQLNGQVIPSERPGHVMREQWHPIGVVGIISAFNFPVAVWSWNTALAWICGDVCVWKAAEKRLEPVSYEAEWAYLPCYDDLGKKSKPIVYVPAPDCSGRMKISRLGGREENFAEWSEVYSEKGGNYEMTIFYSCDKNRKLEVSVNGTKTVLKDLNSNNEVKSVTIPVSLKQGYNTVRMGNNFGWAPDIDRFTVSRQ